jgi:DNA-binding transcriptional MerR regulator
MSNSVTFLSASEAAGRLGVTTKALRLYEQRGLVTPRRTAAGYRAYGPDEMTRASEIVALRALGLSLTQVARVLEGDSQSLESALGAHEASLEGRIGELVGSMHEAVATCLASPEVRARIARCPEAA